METSRIAMVSLRSRPAIIPYMICNAGNRALSTQLWSALWVNWRVNKDVNGLSVIGDMFLQAHPQRFNCISETMRHFNLMIGINAEDDYDYHKTIEEYFDTGW